jgi:hypothetical protein
VDSVLRIAILSTLTLGSALPCASQTNSELQNYFKQYVGLTDNQIAAIRNGQPVAKTMRSRVPAEIFVFGAIYIKADPESYPKFAEDLDRLRKLPEYLAIRRFSNPPQLSDLNGFTFEREDIRALENCKPGNCQIQLPASRIEEFRQSIHWSAPDVDEQVNQLLQKAALQRLVAYQHGGNRVLGLYNDKKNSTEVAEQFKYMLSYSEALPKMLPDFHRYLLDYPDAKPANVEDTFSWSKVKFGLKPTLRVVQVVTMHGNDPHEPVYAIAEKQLYSSHYFETALNLTYCIRGGEDPKQPGFYLIMAMGSEQAGLTGFKGSIVRKVAVDRSASSLQKSLAAIKNTLEQQR